MTKAVSAGIFILPNHCYYGTNTGTFLCLRGARGGDGQIPCLCFDLLVFNRYFCILN